MRILLIIILTFVSGVITAQERKREIEGVVTYLSEQNVYIKFLSASGIKSGDKIFVRRNDVLASVLIVSNTSSVSCVCKSNSAEPLKIGDKVIALISPEDAITEKPNSGDQQNQSLQDTVRSINGNSVTPSPRRLQRVDGRIQISSYSNMSSLPSGTNSRMRYIWSMNGSNIGNSRISLDSYISFSHQINNWAPIKENIFYGLKIYDLNLKYEAGANSTIWLGRKINPKLANIGAIDGIQYEMNLKHFFWGIAVGLRPDYMDYSFNKNLFEYGGFLGHILNNKYGVMQTSIAGFNQTNTGKTDRRFVYIQHDNSLSKVVNFFFSSEFDLYKVLDGLPVNEPSLTSLYLMLNCRITRNLSLSGSYDNRRNIIYYETYKNYIDIMLADATRQGVQIRINYKPFPLMNLGLSSSYWDRTGDSRPTRNLNGIFSYSRLPFMNADASITVNILQTSYVAGIIYGIRVEKYFIKGKLNWGMNYRYVDYTYLTSSGKLLEHIASSDFSVQFTRKFSLSANYEGTFEKTNIYHQIYCTLTKRF